METIAKFEKVSEAQYLRDWKQYRRNDKQAAKNAYTNILLPKRATKGSAGYNIARENPYACIGDESALPKAKSFFS